MRPSSLGMLASALIFCIGPARAATTGNLLSVTTTVVSTCNFSAPPILFAPHAPAIGAPSGYTTLTVACSTTSPFNVVMDGRRMHSGLGQLLESNGSYTLQYEGTGVGAITVSVEY